MLKTIKEGEEENNSALPSQISHHKYEHDLNRYLQANSVTISSIFNCLPLSVLEGSLFFS